MEPKHSHAATWFALNKWGSAAKNMIGVDPDGYFGIAFVTDAGEMVGFIEESDVPQFIEAARTEFPQQAAHMQKLLMRIPYARKEKQWLDSIANN